MKKFVTWGALAVALAAVMACDAFAWKNTQFGVGLNWNCQSGGNSLLFGLFQNGQPPAPDCGIGGPGYVPAPGPVPCPGPAPCPGGGLFHGQLAPDANAANPATAVGRTQNRMYPNYGQAVNYQYYNYYYGYGR